ncbi:thiamine-phosphate kinase [Nocardia seriolae]|uniref:Thiamine-monophosphate kinase n=1 Tax=Nocardia seriolae TaxID=37332 RepID=A0ABC8B2D3_9NOCA|nr:thiamine-phosphate kinase [Nocardia seriolae]APB00579.1 Thiamine-phosphate kinase [Nocardia seriolae]MTJ61926.1 thiamine-phosphate kinase [Nocardia seriolae]MTJ74974.1 thiamine-phosphate kinase [Nocardia seriolae]MTJ90045.1 thiamine-phosphate kinase [Nocardia seriolae]MTK34018.1 thiamine-phosphate kinase [Nocardia seriolae]
MGELGEFALIALVNAGRTQTPGVLLGPGDDAAVIAAPEGRFVVTTDMLVQDRHFRTDWSSPHDIGRKAIAQNAADVVAMGAVPSAFVVGLGCPSDTPVEFVRALADGMWAEAGRAGASIAGGDMVRSPILIVSVTAFGDPRRAPIRLTGARPGDLVAVAGKLGWSGAGLAVLSAEIERPELGAPVGEFADVVAVHRVPQPPYDAVLELPDSAEITALTDVSDGLLADLGHIAESSGVAIDLESAALADPELEVVGKALGVNPLDWILTGGEDHAFAATFADSGDLPEGWVRIGRVRAGSGVTVDGTSRTGPAGWESFA